MSVYPEKRKGEFTGVWIAEPYKAGKRLGRERFRDRKDAEHWHNYMELVGHPPPMNASGKPAKDVDQGPTVGRVVNEHLAEWQGRDPKHALNLRYIERIWEPETPIAKIDEASFDALVKSLKDRPGKQGRKKLAAGTINRYLAAASTLMKFAKRKKYIKDRPEIEWREEDGKRIHWLNEAEEARVGAAMLAEGWADAELTLRVLTRTGMRWGEFEGLEPKDIVPGWVRLTKTKTNTPRDIPIVPALENELRNLVIRGVPEYRTFRVQLASALKSAGENEAVTIHCLRHSAATRLVLGGAHPEKVQKFMGHKTYLTTQKYLHVAPKDIEGLATILSCNAGETKKASDKSAA